MCGINGIYAYHYASNPVDQAELNRTRDDMAARGPDGKGEWISEDARVAFGHRRLAIIDLSEFGRQPMMSADGALVITFNGEIFNYRELRLQLERKGRTFRTGSDTEVLLHLYAQRGERMVEDLRGMFAFAIWDSRRRRLLLARDPYGIKPLYYADDGWTFRFATQVKALLAGGKVSRDPDPVGQIGFYLWGAVPEPFTTYQDIRSLPAGSILWVDSVGPHEPKGYFSIAEAYCRAERACPNLHGEDIQDIVREVLSDSVAHHLVSDVPVGGFLSAGVDSGALLGLMRDAGQQDIQTVTIAFEEFRGRNDDEAPLAAKVAAQYGTCHTTRVVTEAEFWNDLPRILDAMDQPTIDGINTWFASKAAVELGLKVAVSGLGGDELFGGYSSFSEIPTWVGRFGIASNIPGLGRLARRFLSRCCGPLGIHPKAAGLIELGGDYASAYFLKRGLFMPWELEGLMNESNVREALGRLNPVRLIRSACTPEPRTLFAKIATLESAFYMRNQLLRDTDWASMAHGLEVRVPLVDHVLLTRLAPILVRHEAARDKNALAMSPSQPLVQDATSRAKTGFSTPIATWLAKTKAASGKQGSRAVAHTAHWSRRWAQELGTTNFAPRLAGLPS